jgi:EAL domain-containing protein (putative c-di-GMP-specific phosphodiesterase class I)
MVRLGSLGQEVLMVANRLLVLADDPRVLTLLVDAGQRSRYEVTPTESASQFQASYDAATPTLILIDLERTEADGPDPIWFLIEQRCTAPIILVSGSDSGGRDAVRRVRTARDLTIIGALAKPFPPEALTALLEVRREPDIDEWTDELRSAIEDGELSLHYLPTVEMATGRVVGFEALARWFHPRRGLISPNRFIPLAEETGLSVPLTDYVLARAIAECASWSAAGFELSVAVNIVAQSLTNVHILDEIERLRQNHHLPANRITLEVAESAAMRQPELTTEVLTRLRSRGVNLALDDFGTGSSNLRRLIQMPFTELKIDRSFVNTVVDSHENQTIVRVIVAIAKSLGLTTVAEGVESPAVWHWLVGLGIERCQGFAIARPMPSDRVLGWLASYTPQI